MEQSKIFQVVKIFPLSPYVRVCKEVVEDGALGDAPYTLGPDALVLLPGQPIVDPKDAFSATKVHKRHGKPIGYAVHASVDDDFTSLPKFGEGLMALVSSTGKSYVTDGEMRKLIYSNFVALSHKGRASPWNTFKKLLCSHLEPMGFIEPVYLDKMSKEQRSARGEI